MANKKVSQLTSKPAVNLTDLFLIADPTSGQAFKTTISDLGTAIGSGVSSVNTLVGAVVLDTDDIQELASPTNRWFTDTRARAAISAGTGISYNSGTGVITNAVTSGQIATALGYTPANDANVVKLTGDQTIAGNKTFSAGTKHDNAVLLKHDFATVESGYNTISAKTNGLVLWIGGVTRYHDLLFSTSANYVYTFPSATGTLALTSNLSAYLPLTGGTLTGDLTISSGNPRLYFTDTDNNPDYFISNTDGTFTVYDVTNSTSRFTIGTTGNATFTNAITGGGSITGESIYSNGIVSVGTGLTVGTTISATGSITGASIIRSGGTSSQFLKADGSVDSSTYLTTGTASSTYLPLGGGTLTGALFATSASFSGFVGFGGNTSPLAAIDVTGAGRFSSTISAAGATLTGALSGTSATFSGDASFGSGASDVTITIPTNNSGSGYAGRILGKNSTGQLIIQHRDNSATFVNAITISSGGGVPQLTFGGAATFSSSVTATAMSIVNSNPALTVTDNTNTSFFATASSGGAYGNGTTAGDAVVRGSGGISLVPAGGAFTALKILSGGNVGIGTTSPGERLHVAVGAGSSAKIVLEEGGAQSVLWTTRNSSTNGDLRFQTMIGGTVATRMTIDYNGSLGIGTVSPTARLHVEGGDTLTANFNYASNGTYVRWQNNGTSFGDIGSGSSLVSGGTTNDFAIHARSTNNIVFSTNFSEKMRVTNSGTVLVNTTSLISNDSKMEVKGDSSNYCLYLNAPVIYAGTYRLQRFYANGSAVGDITSNGTTTNYGVTSDYRLKEDLKSIKGLEIVNKIKVYDYKWKASDTRMDGVLAHELAEILPYAVSGVKDGEQMQGVDYSKIVPVMVQAIKELKAELDTLKNK